MTQGYVLKIPFGRRAIFADNIDGQFAQPVPSFSHGRGSPLVVFISAEEGCITHLATGRPGVNAGTDLRRLNLEEIHVPQTPLRFADILEYVPANVRRHIASVFERGGVLPPGSFTGVVGAIHELDPNISPLLTRYGVGRAEAIANLPLRARESLAAQKEAVNTALGLANFDRKPLLEWTPSPTEQRTSFLDGLPQAYLREDLMILNDLNHIPGLNHIRSSITSTARFEGQGVRLDVILANRMRLEEQTGADLIYYNATYQSFVMVQYKAMEQVENEHGPSFRLPNSQLNAEIFQMDRLIEQLRPASPPSNRDEYRFTENPFFIKLCPRIILDPDNVDLTPGMYFSRDHWRFLEVDTDLVGPRGGHKITYQNMRRYLNNTQFADLVQNAWVGTTPAQSSMLEAIISEILQEGKAVIIAIKSKIEIQLTETEDNL